MKSEMGFDFDDEDFGLDSDSDEKGIASDSIGGGVTTQTVEKTGQMIALTQEQMTKASTEKLLKSNEKMMKSNKLQSDKMTALLNTSLAVVNTSIINLHQDIAEPLNAHIQNSNKFYEVMTTQIAQQTSSLANIEKMLLEDGIDDLVQVITSKNTYVAPFVNAEENWRESVITLPPVIWEDTFESAIRFEPKPIGSYAIILHKPLGNEAARCKAVV